MFWPYAITHAAFVYNRRPHSTTGKAPYTQYYNEKPALLHLLPFGTQVVSSIPKEYRTDNKFSSRGLVGVYLGGKSYSGYRVFDPEQQRVTIVNNVKPVNPHVFLPGGDLFRTAASTKNEIELVISDLEESVNSTSAAAPENSLVPSQEPATVSVSGVFPEPVESRLPLPDPEEPLSLQEAYVSASAAEWRVAVQEELHAHEMNRTWSVVLAPPASARPISSKWVLTTKRDPSGNVRRKARLVARGFSQREGVDFGETYSPVADRSSLRLLFSLFSSLNFVCRQIDINTAYLHGIIDRELFMGIPEGVTAPPT
jgi:hypothetical protein